MPRPPRVLHLKLSCILLGLLVMPGLTAATPLRRPAFAPPPGALVLTALGLPSRLCLGDRTSIDVFVADVVYGVPPGGAMVSLASSLGASDSVWTPGGMTRLSYRPHIEGSDSIQLTATAPTSVGGVALVPATVERCRWTWELTYTGTFPHPEGFWIFSEQASVAQGTLDTEGDGSRLSGSGTVAYAFDAHGAVPGAACDFSTPLSGSTSATLTGSRDVVPGSLWLSLKIEPGELPGGATIDCKVFGELVASFPIPATTAPLGTLGIFFDPVIVPTDYGSVSREVSSGVVWQVPGQGTVTLVVRRINP